MLNQPGGYSPCLLAAAPESVASYPGVYPSSVSADTVSMKTTSAQMIPLANVPLPETPADDFQKTPEPKTFKQKWLDGSKSGIIMATILNTGLSLFGKLTGGTMHFHRPKELIVNGTGMAIAGLVWEFLPEKVKTFMN